LNGNLKDLVERSGDNGNIDNDKDEDENGSQLTRNKDGGWSSKVASHKVKRTFHFHKYNSESSRVAGEIAVDYRSFFVIFALKG